MTALPVITDTIRASAEGTCVGGQPWANILHFRKTPILTFAGAIALLDPILFSLWNAPLGAGTRLLGNMPTAAGINRIRYTPLDGSTATTVIPHVAPGLDVGDPLPSSVCLVVSFYTALRGRRHRGRFYSGPYTESGNTLGRPTAAIVTNLAAQFVGFQAALAGTGVSHVVASYIPPGSAEDVVTASVNGRWDTQRRRLGA